MYIIILQGTKRSTEQNLDKFILTFLKVRLLCWQHKNWDAWTIQNWSKISTVISCGSVAEISKQLLKSIGRALRWKHVYSWALLHQFSSHFQTPIWNLWLPSHFLHQMHFPLSCYTVNMKGLFEMRRMLIMFPHSGQFQAKESMSKNR